jgi:pilus assembly protein CpaE
MEKKPVNILLIDADPSSRNYLVTTLIDKGFSVASSSSGREGMITAWRDHPDLIILDPTLADISGPELVTRLRQDRRTANLPLIALGHQDHPMEKAALLAAGCNEYLVKSGLTLQTLLDIIPRVIKSEEAAGSKGKLIVFLSAKGGTGTSSLCANIAMAIASQKIGKKVAVIDLVLPIGSIANIVGYKESANLVTVAAQEASQLTQAYFKDNLPHILSWNFNLLAGAPDPESANHLSGEKVGGIVNAIVEAYDYIVVDLGRSLSRISMPIIQQADVIALILSTDVATANLTLTVWEYLKTQGVDPARMYAIQNRAVGLEGLTKGDVEKKIGLPVRMTMPYMGDNFTVANNRNEPIITRFANNSAALLLKEIGMQMADIQKIHSL